MADEPRLYRPRPRDLPPPDEPRVTSALNPDQAHAVTFGDRPLLVIAGAGTGKTRTLIHRVAALLDRGIPPERILLLTFTRRAAAEMLSRAERLVGSASHRVHGGTFHSVGYRLLRQFGQSAGLPAGFTIMDQGDAEDLMQLARGSLGLAKGAKRFPKKETLHWLYSRHVNTELPLDELLHRDVPHFLEYEAQITELFADYTLRKQERNLVDYDDLLLFWATMLEASPDLQTRIAGLYEHVLVDEYQDTNLLQARILRGMCGHGRLTVVGDDAQSIYSFRGAHFKNILDFPRQFPGTTMVTLEQNYRSTQPILDLSNIVISRAEARVTKELYTKRVGGERPWLVTAKDEAQQTRFVADRVLQLLESGVPLREMAVLFRAGYMSADLEIELTARNIPFEKWGGLKFLEAAHIKDVLAFLRVSENPRDEVSWYRILMLMPGIGDSTARTMMTTMQERAWDPDAFTHLIAPPRAREAHRSLAQLLKQLRGTTNREGDGGGGARVASDIAAVRAIYDAVLREKYDRPEARLADLDQLRTIAVGYPSRTGFLSALALDPPSSTQDLAGGSESESDTLVLSTVHSAKGKEWKAVFVIWAVDGWFPASKAIEDPDQLEEERRLMYVALTRAKDELAVIYPMQVYGSRRSADYSVDQISRFLDRGVRATMQRVVVEEEGDVAPTPAPTAPAIDLRAIMRGRFTGGSA